jgi:ribosomal protein S18 acetylase RimI-like enzyme
MKSLPSDLEIRRLNGTDAEAFQVLRRELTTDNPVPMGLTLDEEMARTLEGFRDQLSYPEPNAAFGAFVSGSLVGTAAVAWPSKLLSSRHKTNLWGVFVSPRCRRRGLGRALVLRAVGHAFENGVRRVNLQVYVPNTEAVSLYASLGFVQCGFEPEAVCLHGVYHDGIYMSLQRNEA